MKELNSRILFTIVVILLYRLGTYISLRHIDSQKLKESQNQGGLLEIFNAFSDNFIAVTNNNQ